MHYRPDTALLGTVEFDHADIYRDLDHVCWVFERFVNLVPRRGLLIRHDDSELTQQVSRNAFSRVQGYGLRHGEWRAEHLIEDAESTRFRLVRDGRELAEVRMGMPGEHNVLNALAVSAAAFERGVSAESIAAGLGSFQGVARRQQIRGVESGVTVIDDFAHHPTAIAASVKSIRHRFPKAKVWAVLEPRSWSLRRKVFQQRLESSFGGADEVLIADVFRAADIPAEERLDPEVLVHHLDRGDRPAHFLPRTEQILEHLLRHSSASDVVLVMSNGGFDQLHERLLEGLRRREGE
jgi:UDP-N-acetylmuramate: L-alanyl-gamma-D-glutamyl-meso-diaminopimelate ligase